MAEAVEVREALERLQALSLEVSEQLDAYQQNGTLDIGEAALC